EVSRTEHERVGRRTAEVIDALVTIGDEARVLGEAARAAGAPVQHATSRDEAEALLRALIRPGDTVLIKGSHALGLEAVVASLETQPERTDGGAR
ncbi:MAG: UDP-N-acetylmuramoylalanyl-D-glutamate--2,6-diaminopimelate ligase, partial [Dehalococcoidia bacterium]|nr:UDP-N-acetylmuramoylalanyl-D-glutamate--2,6-diaminopimelate ligase [Dehalococcoidia bacterium]